MYFGFIWTRHLDIEAGKDNSRNVLIFYLVALGLCFGVYSVSRFFQDDDDRTEIQILSQYMDDFVAQNASVANQWGIHDPHFLEIGVIGTRTEGVSEADGARTSEYVHNA